MTLQANLTNLLYQTEATGLDPQTALAALLCEVRHLADRRNLAFDVAAKRSRRDFLDDVLASRISLAS